MRTSWGSFLMLDPTIIVRKTSRGLYMQHSKGTSLPFGTFFDPEQIQISRITRPASLHFLRPLGRDVWRL
jgi:hypothetical protein